MPLRQTPEEKWSVEIWHDKGACWHHAFGLQSTKGDCRVTRTIYVGQWDEAREIGRAFKRFAAEQRDWPIYALAYGEEGHEEI
jgi:hypothetical protein